MSDLHSPEIATVVARKVRRHVLPLLVLAWFVAYIDRFNVSFAALQMNDALGLSAAVYGLGAGIFFLGYAIFEIPSNLLLTRIGPRRWLARIMVTWGVISAAMMFTQGPASFYTLRFLLGVAEAGCFPGMAYYLSQWLAPRERAAALGTLSSMAMFSGVVGAPMASGLLALDGAWGLAGWQWLFLIEGVPAVVLGFCLLSYLPDGPDSVRWLTSEERVWVRAHMRNYSSERSTAESLRMVVRDARYWLWALAFFCATLSGGAFRVFQPVLFKEVSGLSSVWSALLSAIPALAGAAAIIYVGHRASRVDERRWSAAVPMAVAAVGLALVGVTYGIVGPLVVGSIAMVGAAAQPPLFASVSASATGSVSAIAIAFVNSVSALGAFVGPYLVGYLLDAGVGLSLTCALAGAVMATGGVVVLSVRERRPAPVPIASTVSAT